MSPLVSVILPVHNGHPYIRDAVNSIQEQSLVDIEIVVIDDGSSDKTPEILDKLAKSDTRIRVFRNTTPSGICYSLNKAISHANSEFIARMDADDISNSSRLERQLALFRSDPDLIVAGSAVELIDYKGEEIGLRHFPETHNGIVEALADYSPFCHPSVMFRKGTVLEVGAYRESFRDAEDYDLWLRLRHLGTMANLPEALLKYRIHPGQLTVNKLRNQHKTHMRARREALGLGDYSLQEKLRGRRGTLGNKYLGLAYQQQQLGQPGLALRLCLHSLLNSPLSRRAWGFMANRIKRTSLYNNSRWYLNKLRSSLGG